MEPESSLPQSQVPATCPYPDSAWFSPYLHFLKIHLNIILSSTPGSPHWSLSLRFPHQHPEYASPLPHTRYIPRPSHSPRFYHPHNNGRGYRSLSSSLCSFLYSPVTSSLLGPNNLLNTQFSNIRSLFYSLTVSNQEFTLILFIKENSKISKPLQSRIERGREKERERERERDAWKLIFLRK